MKKFENELNLEGGFNRQKLVRKKNSKKITRFLDLFLRKFSHK
jgi:hypothetical protein